MRSLTFASFFSGVEGFGLAFAAAGFQRVFSCEIDPFCRKVHEARFGAPPEWDDIRTLDAARIPDADVWCAGWPCQGLSVAGLRKGLADERSGLFWELLRLVEQKRPLWLCLENVPGLLTACSCARCGRACRGCGAVAGADDESCQVCGGERLGGRVLPEHRGSDFFVVLTALQGAGYGVETRILDAQFLGVAQRRRRVFFGCRSGGPCPPEILSEPQGGGRDSAARGEEGAIAAGALARSVGAVGGGDDYGANKGTLVASPLTSRTGRTVTGDTERENLVASAVTASAGHHGHSSPRGDGADNLVAGTLQSCSGKQGRKTPEPDQLVATPDKTAPTVLARQKKGAFTDPANDGLVCIHADAMGGRSGDAERAQPDAEGNVRARPPGLGVRADGKAFTVSASGHHGVAVPEPISIRDPRSSTREKTHDRQGVGLRQDGKAYTVEADHQHAVAIDHTVAAPLDTQHAHGGAERAAGGHLVVEGVNMQGNKSGAGPFKDKSPSLNAMHGHDVHAVAVPLTAGSNPNSNAAGRRKEDDQNLVVCENGGDIQTKSGQAPCLRDPRAMTKTGVLMMTERSDDGQLTLQLSNRGTAPTLTGPQQAGGCDRLLVAKPEDGTLFIDAYARRGSSSPNQSPVKTDGKSDALDTTGPGAVAFNAQCGGSQDRLNPSDKPDALSAHQVPAVAFKPLSPALLDPGDGCRSDAVRVVAPTIGADIARQAGGHPGAEEYIGAVERAGMMVRRLTPTECERLQGFPDGWTCTCSVGTDCGLRRVPGWLDPRTFRLGGCGHSACGCRCSDSARYKSMGNAVAVPVVRWIADRIAAHAERSM